MGSNDNLLSKGPKRSPRIKLSAKVKALAPYLKLGKVSDNFFRVIVKKGSLVSLLGGKASKGRPTLANLFSKVGFRIFGAVFTNGGKYLSRLRQLNAFRVHIDIKRRHHGEVFVVKYLKVSQLSVQKAIAGTGVSSLRTLEPGLPLIRTASQGLPSWIPLRDRRLILVNGSPSVIRWYLTLLSVYRVISIPGVFKLTTITDQLTVAQEAVDRVAQEVTMLVPKASFDLTLLAGRTDNAFKVGRPGIPDLPLLESASATSKVAWLGLFSDVIALSQKGQLHTMLRFLALTGNKTFGLLLQHIYTSLPSCENMIAICSPAYKLLVNPPIGRLALKDEAAGKVRVFAMVTL